MDCVNVCCSDSKPVTSQPDVEEQERLFIENASFFEKIPSFFYAILSYIPQRIGTMIQKPIPKQE